MATILIVDDEENALKMLAQALKVEGYDTLTASSGEEALQLCASKTVDLVLLDILMPGGIDGVETLTSAATSQTTTERRDDVRAERD